MNIVMESGHARSARAAFIFIYQLFIRIFPAVTFCIRIKSCSCVRGRDIVYVSNALNLENIRFSTEMKMKHPF